MKYLLALSLIFTLLNCYSQIITLDRMLALEGKAFNEAQGILLGYGLDIVDVNKYYSYKTQNMCDPPKFKEDNCTWFCARGPRWKRTKYKSTIGGLLELVDENGVKEVFKNYEETFKEECFLAQDYDLESKAAVSFIDFYHYTSVNNFNCKDEFGEPNISTSLVIKLNKNHWKRFKNDLVNKFKFIKSYKYFDETKVRYGMTNARKPQGYSTIITYTMKEYWIVIEIEFFIY